MDGQPAEILAGGSGHTVLQGSLGKGGYGGFLIILFCLSVVNLFFCIFHFFIFLQLIWRLPPILYLFLYFVS